MKRFIRTMATAFCTAVLVAGLTSPAFSQRAKETNVTILDSAAFDGETLYYTYTIKSRCAAREHDSWIEVNTKSRLKTVSSYLVMIVDSAFETECAAKAANITVSGSANVADVIAEKKSALLRKGYKTPTSATFALPEIRTSGLSVLSAATDYTTPPVTPPVAPPVIAAATVVNVTEISYAPSWRCVLYKNDGARNDGFEGTGATLADARRSAASGCKSTNNPYCDQYSQSPDHTTCDAQLTETTKVTQYDSSKLPPNAVVDSWACTLNKNDGSVTDGFTGTGKTETAARADAAHKCSSTNISKCSAYSNDSGHTACNQVMILYGPKPVAVWKCTMWKNDGSRNDGFKGSGSTEAEARRNTMPGCQSTNNPYCLDYSNDPSHTICNVDFMYPQ